jgi:hypothetical protein
MNTRLALTALVLLLALCACSEDKTTDPGTQPRVGVTLDGFADGVFATGTSGDYTITFDAADPDIDPATIVDLGSGNKALKDSDNTNDTTTRVTVTSTDQRLFSFDALDAADLLDTADSNARSGIILRGYHATTSVGTDFLVPFSSTPGAMTATNLTGVPVSRVELEIRSETGTFDDDLCVSFLDLTALSSALLDFDALPLGEIEFLNVGEFRMTWTGENDHQVLIDQADGNYALSDGDRDNTDAAAVTIALADGGVFQYDALYATDLLGQGPGETNSESKIVITGFNGTVQVGTETVLPTDDESARFDAGALDGLDITSLVVSIASYDGSFISDDLVIEGFLVTIVE